MIILEATTEKLQLTTSSTEAIHVVVTYQDLRGGATRPGPRASQETAISTATTTDILAAPATDTQRQVLNIRVNNAGTTTNTVTLLKDVGGTDYRIAGAVALSASEFLLVNTEGAVSVYTSAGALKTSTGSSAWGIKIKSADQNRASTTTLADDSELTITLAASSKYTIRCAIFTSIANATMDFKFGTAYSGTVTGTVASFFAGVAGGSAAGTDNEVVAPVSGQIGPISVTAATSGIGHIWIEQSIETSTGGTWSFQWAQNTSDAGNATVHRGSYIEWFSHS